MWLHSPFRMWLVDGHQLHRVFSFFVSVTPIQLTCTLRLTSFHPKDITAGLTLHYRILCRSTEIWVPYFLVNSRCPSDIGILCVESSVLASCRSCSFEIPLMTVGDVFLSLPLAQASKHLYANRLCFQAASRPSHCGVGLHLMELEMLLTCAVFCSWD